jgi:6,7-dimethyl-8-ribityllumazine synthase
MSGYLEDTGDWPFRESAPARPPQEPQQKPDPEPDPEPSVSVTAEPEPEEAESEEAEEPDALLLPEPEEPQVEQLPDEEAPGELVLVEEEDEAAPQHAQGELDVPSGYTLLAGTPSGERRTVGIVVGRFNGEVTNRLLESALAELEEAGVGRDAVTVMPVPGAFELPLAAMALAKTRRYACVVALGCVIRGETPHFDFVASEAASGLQLAAIETGVPVSFGLLTCETLEQAEARVDKGAEAVRAALEMADLFAQLRAQAVAGR